MNPRLKAGACRCPGIDLRGPTFGSMTLRPWMVAASSHGAGGLSLRFLNAYPVDLAQQPNSNCCCARSFCAFHHGRSGSMNRCVTSATKDNEIVDGVRSAKLDRNNVVSAGAITSSADYAPSVTFLSNPVSQTLSIQKARIRLPDEIDFVEVKKRNAKLSLLVMRRQFAVLHQAVDRRSGTFQEHRGLCQTNEVAHIGMIPGETEHLQARRRYSSLALNGRASRARVR